MLRLILVLLGLFAAMPVQAACSVASNNLTFADTGSYTVRQTTTTTTSGGAGFSCTGSQINVLGSNSASATMSSANNFRLSNGAGDSISYSVSADAGGNSVFVQGAPINYFNAPGVSVLTIVANGSFTPQLFAKLSAGSNVAAGTYTDTLTIQWAWSICHGVNIANLCPLGLETGSGTAVIQVKIVVTRDCRVDAPALSFGTAALVSQFTTVTQTIRVDCTKDASYSVALTKGGGYISPWRAMKDSNGNRLRYNLYRDDGVTVWDDTNPMPSPTKGKGDLIPATGFTYKARIDPSQTTPPIGTYSDIVSVAIAF